MLLASPNFQRNDSRQRSGHDDAAFMLFTHSFDTLSENGDYLRDMSHHGNYELLASPAARTDVGNDHSNPGTPRIEIALPELGRSGSECSLVDVSPIKISHRTVPPPPPVGTSTYAHGVPNPDHHPQRHMTQTTANGRTPMNGSAMNSHQHQVANLVGPQSEYDYHWRMHGYPTENEEHVSNPYYVIRSNHRSFAGCTYLLPCLRENDLISVNLNRFGHIRRYQSRPQVCFCDGS